MGPKPGRSASQLSGCPGLHEAIRARGSHKARDWWRVNRGGVKPSCPLAGNGAGWYLLRPPGPGFVAVMPVDLASSLPPQAGWLGFSSSPFRDVTRVNLEVELLDCWICG